jgi:hypothetical protein
MIEEHVWEVKDENRRCIPQQLLDFIDDFFEYFKSIYGDRLGYQILQFIFRTLNKFLSIMVEHIVAPIEKYIGKTIRKIYKNTYKERHPTEIYLDEAYNEFKTNEEKSEGIKKSLYKLCKNLIVVMYRFHTHWLVKVFPNPNKI